MATDGLTMCINKENQVTMEEAVTFIKHGSDNLKLEIKNMRTPTQNLACVLFKVM
jgi:hypothetical protein